MKRKTNLFYTSGPDSKFITFSNYTESLTGNFLSTDTKLFPDKFLCLKIANLHIGDNNTKSKFITYLAKYYENKLAALRDACIANDKLDEQNLLPLSYLLEAILQVCSKNADGIYEFNPNLTNLSLTNVSEENTVVDTQFINLGADDQPTKFTGLITYIGDITEQDYNGTYTDTICSINVNNYYIGTIKNDKTRNNTSESTEIFTCTIEGDNATKLYGWENDNIIFDAYQNNTVPLYDEFTIINDSNNTKIASGTYYQDSFLSEIIYDKIENPTEPIVFNIIIPLFSITNMNYNTNTNMINTNNKHINLKNSSTENGEFCARFNVPLGMWIHADEEEDSYIELKKDFTVNAYPAWSLLISSQFKPFPYSFNNKVDNESQNGNMIAYQTFAETLSKINDVLDKFSKMNTIIQGLDNRLITLERQIKEIGTSANLSRIDDKLLQLNTYVKDEINEFKKQLNGYVDNITWSSRYKNNN